MTRTLLTALLLAGAAPLAAQETPLDSLMRTPRPPAQNVSWPNIGGAGPGGSSGGPPRPPKGHPEN